MASHLSSSLDAFFGVDGLTQDTLDLVTLGASAGGSIAVVEAALTRVKWKDATGSEKSLSERLGNWEAPLVASVGLAGGLALGRWVSPSIGAGWGAGLIGLALSAFAKRAVNWVMLPSPRPELGTAKLLHVFSGVPTSYAGIGQTRRPEEMLLGPGAAALESIRTEVKEKVGVPGMSGLGESSSGNVVVKDKPRFPFSGADKAFQGLRNSGLV